MKSSANKTNQKMCFGYLVLIGLMAFFVVACSGSESANKSIMSVVAKYDRDPRPSDNWLKTSCGYVHEKAVNGARYCFHQTKADPRYTIWFFHGAGDSEQVFLSSPFNQRSFIDLEKELPAVNIVTVSFGPVWLLTDTKARRLEPRDATVEKFELIMRYIERMHDPVTKPYVAMGHSQGGLNVATLCAARPDMWSKCVLLNPMLPDCNPFLPWPVCPAIFSPLEALGPNFLIRANYLESEWRDSQPLVLLQKMNRPLPKSFVTACRDDLFGLYRGPKAWSDRARELNPESSWVAGRAGCDHFVWPVDRVWSFLSNR